MVKYLKAWNNRGGVSASRAAQCEVARIPLRVTQCVSSPYLRVTVEPPKISHERRAQSETARDGVHNQIVHPGATPSRSRRARMWRCCRMQVSRRFTTKEEIVPLTNFCLTPNLILNEGGKLAEGMSHSIFRFPLRHPIESWEIE